MTDLKDDFFRHISSEFNDELETLRSSLLQMGGLVEEQLKSALRICAEKDSDLMDEIDRIEEQINAAEISLDEQVESLIILRQPKASDLRLVLAVSKIVRDLERAGDELEKVAKLSFKTYDGSVSFGLVEIQQIGEQVSRMLTEALTAFARLDADLAQNIFE